MPEQSNPAARLDLFARDEAATIDIAQGVASVAARGDAIGLIGGLGSGKTVFARGFIRGLARSGEEVPSPSFTLVQVYPTDRGDIWHFDLYRLESPEEAWELNIEEAFAEGIALVEWPERLGSLWPSDCLEVTLATVPGGPATARSIRLVGGPSWRDRLGDLKTGLAAHIHA